jgi:hypothetical protein
MKQDADVSIAMGRMIRIADRMVLQAPSITEKADISLKRDTGGEPSKSMASTVHLQVPAASASLVWLATA